MIEPARRNWWQRNWKWFVPVGCVGLIAALALIVVGIVTLVGAGMRSSDAYRQALERAGEDPRVIEALGAPLEPGLWTSGSIEVSGPSGEAALSTSLTGSRGEGRLFLEAKKRAGRWEFDLLEVEVESTGERIDLLERPAPEPLAEPAPTDGT